MADQAPDCIAYSAQYTVTFKYEKDRVKMCKPPEGDINVAADKAGVL